MEKKRPKRRPLRRTHQHLPHRVKKLLNWRMKRVGDPGDRDRDA